MRIVALERPLTLRLGERTYDVADRALVMGILNRTRDSFYAPAATFELDDLYRRAERLVAEGADLLDVGGVKAGPGDEISEAEELDRVVPVVGELARRFDIALSVDTWRASVARECYAVGATLGNDISGFADPDYLRVTAAAGASAVATHIRLRPRVADPHPTYDDVTARVIEFLLERREWARAAGLSDERIILDAGLDLGKTTAHSLTLLRNSDRLAALGSPVLLSASNKTFLGTLFDQGIGQRRESSLAACALAVAAGCRILRVHDVAGTLRVRDTLAAISERVAR